MAQNKEYDYYVLSVPNSQLQTYHSDFETERKSREKMAGRLEQIKDELQKKDLEVKRLHSHLNKNAASLMKAEMEDVRNIIMYKNSHVP